MEYDEQTDRNSRVSEIMDKLKTLLHCGNERVELAAAKELLNLAENENIKMREDNKIGLDVTIKVLQEE